MFSYKFLREVLRRIGIFIVPRDREIPLGYYFCLMVVVNNYTAAIVKKWKNVHRKCVGVWEPF